VPPILQLLLFAYSVTLEVKNVTVVILNRDMGIHGHELTSRIAGSDYFSDIILTDSPQKLSRVIDNQEALLGITFPQDFSADIENRKGASLQVLSDGRRSNAVQIVTAYLTEIVQDYSLEVSSAPAPTASASTASALAASGLAASAQDQSSATASGSSSALASGQSGALSAGLDMEVSVRHWFNPDLFYVWTIIPSLMAIITLITTLNISAMSLAREKELGTFEQLLVSPFTPAEIIIGKLIPAMSVAVFESMLIYCLGRLIYGVPMRGSLLLLMTGVLLFSFSIIGFGFFVSSIVKNQQQAIVGVFMFMVPSVALSGFAAPIENMPAWLQQAVILNPLKHALIILNGVFLKNMPAHEVWLNAWPLLAIGVASMTFSGWLFRRNLG
jgi:ABC-2 type transport system permease protein